MIGSDFERLLCEAEFPDFFVPAIGLGLPDKKGDKLPLKDRDGNTRGYVHRDNVMLEFCTIPAHDGEEFEKSVNDVIKLGTDFAENLDSEWGTVMLSDEVSGQFVPQDLDSPEAQELGCDLDYVVGDMRSDIRQAVTTDALGNQRHCGGHLHFSWPREEIPAWVGAMMCDLFIGMPNCSWLNADRAGVYGLMGLHRPTKYPDGTFGVEYRALDSGWTVDDARLKAVSKQAHVVHDLLCNGTIEQLQKFVGLWQKHQPTGPVLHFASSQRGQKMFKASVELFRKEFGYDPV